MGKQPEMSLTKAATEAKKCCFTRVLPTDAGKRQWRAAGDPIAPLTLPKGGGKLLRITPLKLSA